MARVATTMDAFNAVAEPIPDRVKGYERFEQLDDVPRADVGEA